MKLPNMFFEFIYAKMHGDVFSISRDSKIISDTDKYASRYLADVLSGCNGEKAVTIKLQLGIPQQIKDTLSDVYAYNKEGYAIEVKGDVIGLYAETENGLIFAVSTLRQLIERKSIGELLIFDYPDKSIRGYRVFTPGRRSLSAFKKMVDMLVYYKYNSIMIEVGGAMEYKRHPEINAKWVEFCKEVHKSPYEGERIQKKTHPEWQKNSIHADNGDGEFITQDEMREIIDYCRERGLSVVPEVPSLCHCDYIVMAHPDIREREADTYPDTYCPSNPKSYELMFDIFDEVIEVFKPEYINIGHDECYTLAKCDKCKDKDPVDLYVEDIEKINNYLKSKNVKSIMWAEKFFDNVYLPDENGILHGFGGTGDEPWDVPRCIGCVGRVPKDVTLLHWYWSLCSGDEEKNIQDMGYEMIFGNFMAASLTDYRNRATRVSGGYVSNWGSFEEEYMQRNGQNFALLTTAWTFWSRDYDSDKKDVLVSKVEEELYARYKKELGEDVIEITHTTNHFRPYKSFYDGYYIVREEWTIGEHIVEYTDGTKVSLPIIYGYNIRTDVDADSTDSESVESTEAKATGYVEALGASFLIVCGDRLFYKTAYKNPYPEKQIKEIICKPRDGINIEVK